MLVHVVTRKGKGYPPAETAADKYHGVVKFNVLTGDQMQVGRQGAELHQSLCRSAHRRGGE